MCVHQAVAGGPRATDRFAAVTAAFVSGLAGSTRAVEVAAFFLDAAASRMEEAVRVSTSVAALYPAWLPAWVMGIADEEYPKAAAVHACMIWPVMPPHSMHKIKGDYPLTADEADSKQGFDGLLGMQSKDSLAAGNLIAVIAHIYGCRAIDAATMYSLLEHLQSRWAGSSWLPPRSVPSAASEPVQIGS